MYEQTLRQSVADAFVRLHPGVGGASEVVGLAGGRVCVVSIGSGQALCALAGTTMKGGRQKWLGRCCCGQTHARTGGEGGKCRVGDSIAGPCARLCEVGRAGRFGGPPVVGKLRVRLPLEARVRAF